VLNVTIEESEKNVILRCVGQIVRGYETALLCAAIGQSDRNIVVDLSQVDAIDAAGVGAFVALQAAGVYLRMLNPGRAMREVLRLAKLDSIFEILASPVTPTEKHSEPVFWPAIAT
jgi:anti-anti-sigma factor